MTLDEVTKITRTHDFGCSCEEPTTVDNPYHLQINPSLVSIYLIYKQLQWVERFLFREVVRVIIELLMVAANSITPFHAPVPPVWFNLF